MRKLVLLLIPLFAGILAACSWRSESFYPSSTGTGPLPTICPICNSPTVPLASVNYDPTQPSPNSFVWNQSICGNVLIGPDSPFCPHCHFVYLPALNQWMRSSEDPKSFLQPFAPAITEFPTPQTASSGMLYVQTYVAGTWTQSISFWFKDQPAYLAAATQYATTHALTLNPDHPSLPGETYIRAESHP